MQAHAGNDRRISLTFGILLVMLCFAGNNLITRFLIAGKTIDPFALTIIRFASGSLSLLMLRLLMPGTFNRKPITRREIIPSISLGIYAFSISFGYEFISASAGTLVFFTFVVLSMSSFSLWRKEERFTFRLLAGSLLGLAGVSVIALSGISQVTVPGILLMAVTGGAWGTYSVMAKDGENYFSYSYSTFTILSVFSIALAVAVLPVTGYTIWTRIPRDGFVLAIFMGTVTTALSYVLWNRVLGRIRSSLGGISQLLVPIFTAVLAVVLLGESITAYLLAGAALVLMGIYLSAFGRRKN